MTPSQALQLSSIREIKDALHMPYVMEHYGHRPVDQDVTTSSLNYLSPFRNESRPSFDVFKYAIGNNPVPEYRYDDRADPDLNQGDVIDLIQLFEPGIPRPEAVSRATELLADQIRNGWEGYTVEAVEKPGLNVDSVDMMVDLRRPLMSSDTWFRTMVGRPGLAGARHLPSNTVFKHHETDTVVFVLRDENGSVRGARLRFDDQTKKAVPGTDQILMRLEGPSPQKPVFLVEGETDLYAAFTHLGERFEVLGVPGVGNHPAQVAGSLLDGRDVTIAFDSDTAGAAGAAAWRDYLTTRDCQVRVVVLGEGQDIASLTGELIRRLPSESRVLPPDTDVLTMHQGQYCTSRTDSKTGDITFFPISSWGFEPQKVLIGEDGMRSYEGILLPRNESVVLPSVALTSKNNLLKWGGPYQARWLGNDVNVQQLAMRIDHQAAFLPSGRVTDQIGLNDGTFVWPYGKIGRDDSFYEAPKADPGFTKSMFSIEQTPCDVVGTFEAMYGSQNPAVTGPILAWLACAPLRSRFKTFPVLSISGASGSGKTALTQELIQVFSGTNISVNLTSTTKFGVETLVSSSNGFPIRFDEYRPGANPVAKLALDQLARDAYEGQTGIKGGQNAHDLSATSRIRTDAPLVITGEDNFSETSHMERMVLVRLVRSEQGNLGALQRMDTEGFAHAYLESLLLSETAVDDAPVFSDFHITSHDRVEFNTKLLSQGWNLLGAFLRYHDPSFEMPALDLSRIDLANEEAAKTDPVMDAVQYYYENDLSQHAHIVWIANGYLNVSPNNLIAAENKNPTVVLPTTSSKGIKDLLIENRGFEAARVRPPLGTNQLNVVRVPLDSVEWLSEDEKQPHILKDTTL